MIKTTSNSESGFTLVGVLAVFTIITVFGISLVMLSISSVKTSNTEHDDQSVFYIAEAGANYMVNEIDKIASKTYKNNNFANLEKFYSDIVAEINSEIKTESENVIPYKFEINERNQEPKVSIDIELKSDSNPVEYQIISVGTIGDQSRTVERTIAIDWPDEENYDDSEESQLLPPFALYTYGKDIHLKKNVKITGNIGTEASGNNDIKIDNKVDLNNLDHIYIPESENTIIKTNDNLDSEKIVIMKDFPILPVLPNFPQFNQVEVTQDKEYGYVELQNDVMDIKANNQDLNIIMEGLVMENSTINITGNGSVTLYIDSEINMNNSTINIHKKISQLSIYSKHHMKLNNNSTLYGSIYINNKHLFLDSSSKLYGNIFMNNGMLKVEDNSTISSEIVLIPNTKVQLDNSDIIGPIIANNIQMTDGSLDHKPPFTLEGPLSFNDLKDSKGNDFKWSNPGQGSENSNHDSNGNLIKPDDKPAITAQPLKEIPTND